MTKQLVIFTATLICSYTSHAITNTVIAVSGTNIVLSWPSFGYESYLVQYRQTLNPSDSWSVLTNAYHANSTNRTTLTLYGAVTGSGGSGGFTAMAASESSFDSTATGPLAVPLDGSSDGVPLALYPPGFDLSSFNIFDPLSRESVSGANYVVSPVLQQTGLAVSSLDPSLDPSGDPQPNGGSGGSPAPTTGFFRVFHIPSFKANFSGYTFTGPTFIPVDYAAPDAAVDYVDSTTVLIGGQPTDNAIFMPYVINGVTNWGVGVYFDRFPNGTNTIQLISTVRESDAISDQTPYITFSNAPAAITIGSLVTYTNWDELIFSNTYTFKAQSSVPNVDWEIDIYDAYDNFVNFQTGHSADGNIAWAWNLTDYNTSSRLDDSDPFFFAYLTITGNLPSSAQNGGAQPNAGSSSVGGWMPEIANQFPSTASWLFSYLDKFYDDGTTKYAGFDTYYFGAINAFGGGPVQWHFGFLDIPLKFGRTYSQTDRDSSWDSLRSWLESWNNRNLYYFGHGASNYIGGDMNLVDTNGDVTESTNFPGSKAHLTSQWVKDNVTHNKTWGPMPFRFVFLDGCNTAVGDWPQAWGVPKQVEPISYYQSPSNTGHARPSAFVGWDVTLGGNADWGTIDKFWQFRQFWMSNWAVEVSTGETLKQAFDDAFNGSRWVDQGHYNHMKIYGYQDMTFIQYNRAGDWP